MIWRRRKPASASPDAIQYLRASEQHLEDAKALRVEAFELSASLNQSRMQNHFGLGLERAMMRKGLTS